MNHEQAARQAHRGGYGCASAVYNAFSDVNPNRGSAPVARSEGGKCGAVLAAEKALREMGVENDFDSRFVEMFGSLKCKDLRKTGAPCNDLVGAAARLVDEYI